MAKINLNALAKNVCAKEGGKVNLPIGQVKEVIRHTLNELAEADLIEVIKLLEKRRCGRPDR